MKRTLFACAVCLLASSSDAWGEAIFLGTQGNTLYRTNGATVETFTLSADLTSMAVAPDGTIWGSAYTDADSDTFHELYTLANPLGASPSLVWQSDFLEDNTPSLTFVGDTLYGIQKTPGADPSTAVLVTIDLIGQSQALVGETGSMGLGGNGTGYDPDTDTFYKIRPGDQGGELSSVDYAPASGSDPAATVIGPMGLTYMNGGAEFYDGSLYALVQEVGEMELLLGSVDTSTGTFTEMRFIADREDAPVALAVIPEPSTLSLLGVFGLAMLRRRG
jgi:hypothetical protein